MAKRSISKRALAGAIALTVLAALSVWYWIAGLHAKESPDDAHATLVTLATDDKDLNTLRITDEGMKILPIEPNDLAKVEPAPPPLPLRLPGSILLDPNLLVRVHSRFPGEVTQIGSVADPALGLDAEGNPRTRPVRYGDRVKKGQVLAIVWCKEIGEKKSELIDAISKRDIDKEKLDRYKSVKEGIISQSQIAEATRNVEADLIAVSTAERTLLSWRVTPDELAAVYLEAKEIQHGKPLDKNLAKIWAEIKLRAAQDGMIVEKNFNVGDIIDSSQDLFKIADLSRVLVLANAYEEDLPELRALNPKQRKWEIDVKADPDDEPIQGTFDRIGSIVDPSQHSAAIMGSLDNSKGKLSVGQFITATITLPPDKSLVAIPINALIEEGDKTWVFVETDEERHEFKRIRVVVVRRGRHHAHILSMPSKEEQRGNDGPRPLLAGQRVLTASVLLLANQLEDLKSDAEEQRRQSHSAAPSEDKPSTPEK